jgi:hypothetical protein
MGLNELNRSVTSAILRAEALQPGSWEAERAFREVAELEEELAAIVGAHTVQGVAESLPTRAVGFRRGLSVVA